MLLATDEEPENSLLGESYWNKLLYACSSLQRNASEVAAMTLIRLAEFTLPPDHLEMVEYCFLSAAAIQSRKSTHPHYGTQPTPCPPCNLLYLAAIPHIHTTVHSLASTVSTVQPAAFRPEDRERRFF